MLDSLLTEISAAQRTVEHVSGTIRQTTYPADSSPMDRSLSVQNSPPTLLISISSPGCPADDDEMADWFIGDGIDLIRAGAGDVCRRRTNRERRNGCCR